MNTNRRLTREDQMDGSFKAEGLQVWKQPKETKKSDGTSSVSLGFPVCKVNDNVMHPDRVAKLIADALNAFPAAR